MYQIRHFKDVISFGRFRTPTIRQAFTLVEMVAVLAILVTLLTVGVSLLHGTGSQARKAGTDMLAGMVEQARTTAITSRTDVVLAIAEPGDLPADDEHCRISLFKVDAEKWPNPATPPITLEGVQISRWQTLNTGIVLLAGKVESGTTPNPLDQTKLTIHYGPSKNLKAQVHAIAFNSRGGLLYPSGSTPVVFRVAEGGYRGSPRVATANLRGDQKVVAEDLLKIGRVMARPYRIDP